MTGDFSQNKWCPIFPELKYVSLILTQIPLPYCSLTSLLFESPNLTRLDIKLGLRNSIIQEFNEQDFKSRLMNNQFLKLARLGFVNKNQRIIPFKSLMDLLDVSPAIGKTPVPK